MTGRRSAAGLHVLDGVLRWPPETFLQWKFERLAARGVRVTVASTVPRRRAGAAVEGAELLRIPSYREPRALKVLGGIADALVLLLLAPSRLPALVKATRGPPRSSLHRTPWRETAGLLRRYLRLARMRPDLVHFEWETAAGHYLPLMAVWNCPVIVSCRGREIHVLPHAPGNERWASRLPDVFARVTAVHCVSEAIREEAVRYGLDVAKARVIRPAVDPGFFSPAPRADPRAAAAQLEVIAVGDLIWVKGWEYALMAVGLLRDRGVPIRLRISGDGVERERILATARDLGVENGVELLGRLKRDEVRDALRRSDALVHPSLAEGIPNAVLEAMACGLPVVVTDAGGTREAVRDGREGFVVAPRDPLALAHALEKLWREPALRASMGRAGRERVQSAFALDDQIEQVLALYAHVTRP